ncbi:MAG: zinc-ribbon domain-containing protein [Gammaproteobacteria bacterium]|nr:zinc-ribbon domain-containing protein [Gammaproteobacteria bacterium]
MYCSKCSAENPDEARFCRQCGFQLQGLPTPDAGNTVTVAPKKSVGRFVGAAILSAMGVLFLLAGLIEGQGDALVFAAAFLGGAYWLYSKR